MAGDTDNLPNGGTESATLTQGDNPETRDTFDPFNTDNEDEIIGEFGNESETEPTEAEEEKTSDDEEGEDEEKTEEDESDEADDKKEDDVTVTLPDGQKVGIEELKNGYLRQSDYSRKTVELANSRNQVSEQAERMARFVEVISDHLARQLPPQPDLSLAYSDPATFTAQKAVYEAALARVNEFVSMADTPKAVKQQFESVKTAEQLADENRKLAELMPMTATTKGREQFFSDALKAGSGVGYTADEIRNVTDHRMLALGYWAAKGMAADKAKEAAKAKIVSNPPVSTPQKSSRGPVGNTHRAETLTRKAASTGSVDDVLAARLARRR